MKAFIIAGDPGTGKTVMTVSYVPKGLSTTPKRLVIDMEASRSLGYKSSEFGEVGDVPKKLLYEFDLWPKDRQVDLQSFLALYRGIKDGSIKPNVLSIDNLVLFQDEMAGWCQTAENAMLLCQEAGIDKKFGLFLRTNFRVGEPNWWKLMKSAIKEFLLDLRKNGIDFVGATEMHNVWQDYGKKGRAPDGLPYQRIIGRSASIWECFEQVGDVVWNLTRSGTEGKVLTRPIVTIDRFIPKCSIVGIPPKFAFTTWARIWEWEAKRDVPDESKMAELPKVDPQCSVSDEECGDPLAEGQAKLVKELMVAGYTNSTEIFAAMKMHKLVYTLDQHNAIITALKKVMNSGSKEVA